MDLRYKHSFGLVNS